ncbi:MAG: tetratricopeptide repeat-containing sensor histidine kinase [Bacteroidota bacterium]
MKTLYLVFLMLSFACGFSANAVQQDEKTSEEKPVNRLSMLNSKAQQSTDTDSILFYSKKALTLAEKHGLSTARSLILMGNGYLESGNHAKALECFTRAVNQYDEENNKAGLATAYSYIAYVFIGQQNHNNAITYLRRSVDILKKINDSARLANALHNLGHVYYKNSKYDSSLIYYSQAQDTYESLGYETGVAYCIGNKGVVYLQQDKLEKAQEFLLHAINILEQIGDDFAITDYRIAYAEVLQHQGKMIQAIEQAREGFQLASDNNLMDFKRDAAYRLKELYQLMNKSDSALYFQTMYYTYRDSVQNIQTVQQLADLRTKFEVSQKQAEVDTLTKRKSIQLIIISALIIILFLAIWLIIIYNKNLKRAREFSRVLNERKDELEEQRKALKELNYMKDKIFSIVSHDLRTPISSLGGISFMIKESMENDNKAMLLEAVNFIDHTVVSLTGLLENLLNWAMFQQGRFTYSEQKIGTKTLINEVVDVFTTFIIAKNIQLKLDLQDDVCIKGDKNSLMTVFRNLLSNALKYTPKGGTISIVSSFTGDDSVEFIIRDTGVGIPPDRLPDLFKLKDNKSTLGTDNEKGLGLGLNLVHEFVTLNHGKISVESTPGKGTTFTLQFRSDFN